ncbi:MAG: hypothetical protein RIC35_20905 [Marinoscillum sp.]
MGIFSRIKNFITGGAAEVSVVFEKRTTDGSSTIRLFVTAFAKDDCKIKEVYLQVRGRETYKKRVQHTSTDSNGTVTTTHSDDTHYDIHYDSTLKLAKEITLNKGVQNKWLAEFEVPPGAVPTFHGKDCFMKWEVQAGLDMPGNDPDSGWVEFLLSKKVENVL